jgi:D-arabinose 5-phosphate isomerase GutQ
MTLALGDALCVAIMEHRAFTPDNFRDFRRRQTRRTAVTRWRP